MKRDIVSLVRDTLVEAGSTFREDKKEAYRSAINHDQNEKAKWVLQTVLILQDISAPMGPLHPQGILKGLRILSELLSRSFVTKLRIGT